MFSKYNGNQSMFSKVNNDAPLFFSKLPARKKTHRETQYSSIRSLTEQSTPQRNYDPLQMLHKPQ